MANSGVPPQDYDLRVIALYRYFGADVRRDAEENDIMRRFEGAYRMRFFSRGGGFHLFDLPVDKALQQTGWR